MKKLLILLLLVSCSKKEIYIDHCKGVQSDALNILQDLPDHHYYRLRHTRSVDQFYRYIQRFELLNSVNQSCLNWLDLYGQL